MRGTDRRADSAGNDCAWYAGDDNWQWCSDYDTASFDAFASCCGCGGGVERIYVCYTDDTDDGAGRRLTASDDATSPPTASPTYAATAVLGDDATSPPTVSSTYAPTALLGSGATSPPTVSSSYVPTHGPTLNTWDLTLGGTYSGSCTNTNGGARDEAGRLRVHHHVPSACGCCDDDDFTSNDTAAAGAAWVAAPTRTGGEGRRRGRLRVVHQLAVGVWLVRRRRLHFGRHVLRQWGRHDAHVRAHALADAGPDRDAGRGDDRLERLDRGLQLHRPRGGGRAPRPSTCARAS